jgi:ATP-dependent DNA helicase RecG
MRVGEIHIPVSRIRGVGPANAERLKTLGIATVGNLLTYWPRDWDDRTVRIPLSRFAEPGRKVNTPATVVAHEWFGFGRMKTLKIVIEDDDGTQAELVCFNRPFLEKSFPVGDRVSVNGTFQLKYGNLQSTSFDIDAADEAPAKVLPVYPLTAGLTQAQLRKTIANAIAEYGRGIESELPESVRMARGLPSKMEVILAMHAPSAMADAERARYALIFEELFLFECAIGRRSIERRGKLPDVNPASRTDGTANGDCAKDDASTAQSLKPANELQSRLLERMTFSLTKDQVSVVSELNDDLAGNAAMARLLQGDVGSGKTLVSFFACLKVIGDGGQCAILAPTELLARQHAENAAKVLEPIGVRLAFLTGNLKAGGRAKLLGELAGGRIDLVIGTHALFSSGVEYNNLRLVVIDEQHRFGVLQRSAIIEKGTQSNPERKAPHMLMMSATPIPRTLALSMFGDLDVSVIRTMPPGRKPVITHLAAQGNEAKVYDFIRNEIDRGHQAYFVYPLIDQSDALSLKSAEDMSVNLRERIFPDTQVALIHSKIPEDEQREIMAKFRAGETKILVATSVVEVGVDVANATCMVIEHAERFGLSALHQLRGRVGRSELQSWCFLVYSKNLTEDGKARLKVMHETTDGFVLAEEDLKIRGPGDIAGIQQSGYVAFELADPIRDQDILLEARAAAFAYLLEKTDKM